MDRKEILAQIQKKSSYLCIGLDTELSKVPTHLHSSKDPVFEFNKRIIESTHQLCVAYKINIAFYEALGAKGWETLQKTLDLIPQDIFTIADAKRGDIGNTSKKYAQTFFDKNAAGLDFDAVTVAPYMGYDSVAPFLEYDNKWVILLALTSNKGSQDFQMQHLASNQPLYQKVLSTSATWGNPEQMMYVVGATQADKISEVRAIVPENFLLVPGIGAQGGSLEEVSKFGMNRHCGLLVNSSRGILYASSGDDFAKAAQQAAEKIQKEMQFYLQSYMS